MAKTQTDRIRCLINRLARLDAVEGWSDNLNPTQIAALGYLGRSNRFSRSPSHVAEYLGTTRGTMSQTLKSLEGKGFVAEQRAKNDKRAITYQLTKTGLAAVQSEPAMVTVLNDIATEQVEKLGTVLEQVLSMLVDLRGGRSFGVCHTCRYHEKRKPGSFCLLLKVSLTQQETGQICHEQRNSAA